MICFPLNNVEYEADALGAWCATRTRGVFAAEGHYSVEPNGDMAITVSPGLAWLKADTHWGVNAFEVNPTALTVDIADGALSRIDAVCIQLNKNLNTCAIVVKKGAHSPQPAAIPPIARNLDYDEIYVATIVVRAGATSILPGDITDQRLNEAYCGIMRDGVTGIPSQALYDQWKGTYDEYVRRMDEYQTEQKAEWEAWVTTLRGILDDETAGHLQLEIDALTGSLDDLEAAHIAHANNTEDPHAIDFVRSTTRENILPLEKLSTAFGKIDKYFADLSPVAFSGSANDISAGLLSILQGGTGANTSLGALTNLGFRTGYISIGQPTIPANFYRSDTITFAPTGTFSSIRYVAIIHNTTNPNYYTKNVRTFTVNGVGLTSFNLITSNPTALSMDANDVGLSWLVIGTPA